MECESTQPTAAWERWKLVAHLKRDREWRKSYSARAVSCAWVREVNYTGDSRDIGNQGQTCKG